MTRLIYSEKTKTFGYEDKHLWWWEPRVAMDNYGNDLPCYLSGFTHIQDAIDAAQGEYYIHSSCVPFLASKDIRNYVKRRI